MLKSPQPIGGPISALAYSYPSPSLGHPLLLRWSFILAIPPTLITARVITGIESGFPATGRADGRLMDGRGAGFGGIGDMGLEPIRIRF